MGTGFKFQMGMGMKSLKWEGIGTKNLFPHTSKPQSSQRPRDAYADFDNSTKLILGYMIFSVKSATGHGQVLQGKKVECLALSPACNRCI